MIQVHRKNPYWKSYVCLALICCLLFVVLFSSLNFIETKKTKQHYSQEKAELIMDDFEHQIDLLKNITLSICIDTKFQPFYFKQNKYNEKVMLEDFKQYMTKSILSQEAFLYYGGTNIFHSSEHTKRLTTYLQDMDEQEISQINHALSHPAAEVQMLPLKQSIYLIFPLRSVEGETTEQDMAVLCFIMPNESIENRFQTVTGGIDGTVSLYKDGVLVFSNQETACSAEEKSAVCSKSSDRMFTLCYLPESAGFWYTDILLTQLALTGIAVLCLIAVATMFANVSTRRLEDVISKYRPQIPSVDEAQAENILMEIDSLLDNSVQTNMEVSKKLAREQSLIYQQCLQMLLDGNYSLDMYTYLTELHITISGPYYYVINLSFHAEAFGAEAARQEFIQRLNELSHEKSDCYVYALYNRKGHDQHVSAICSISKEEQKIFLTQEIIEIATDRSLDFDYGVGNTYSSLSQLHASWLEGMENLYISTIQKQKPQHPEKFTYDSQALDSLIWALADGDETQAENLFSSWIEQLEGRKVSVLMQRYVFSEFLSEISRLARRCHITLSNQNISLLVAADDIEHFKTAALQVIYEFLSLLSNHREQLELEQNNLVNAYIQDHFKEYDLSIEKAAADLSLSTTTVRKAVLQQTGRMYKEQIIYLRIEYAKELLQQNNSVSDVCRMVGYGNDSYFIKVFKKMTGTTPSAYRKLQLKA